MPDEGEVELEMFVRTTKSIIEIFEWRIGVIPVEDKVL
jgi:hypothetical protein